MTSSFAWDLDALVYDYFVGEVDKQLYANVLHTAGLAGINKNVERMRIDDFGCGTGNLTRLLPALAEVRAIDISLTAIMCAYPKVSTGVRFHHADFYGQEVGVRNSDVAIACRSLYHHDLSRSLGMLSRHLSDTGMAVVAHAMPDIGSYVFPQFNGTRSFSPRQAVKALSRMVKLVGVDYRFFEAQEFERAGRQHFNDVKVELGGFGTHYVVTLRKGSAALPVQ